MLKIIGVVLVLLCLAVVGMAYKYGFIFNPSPNRTAQGNSVYEFSDEKY